MADKYFTNVEEIEYSFVEYIPLVGSVYSFHCAGATFKQGDMQFHWHSVSYIAESVVRDVVLFSETAEPASVVLIHTMSESFTDKLIDIYTTRYTPNVKGQVGIQDKSKTHVIIAGSTKEKTDDIVASLFKDKAKGVHYFHLSRFLGTFKHPQYAPNGEQMCLRLPQGIYEGAPVLLMWTWTTDPTSGTKKPDQTYGGIKLVAGGAVTQFLLSSQKGTYTFAGDVTAMKTIDVYLTVGGSSTKITMTRAGNDTGSSALLTVDVP